MKGKLAFVIHKHHATTLHYDFRLEIGGVMVSWAIPKGPSLDNTVKRLAMPTEDHSMEYNSFEGVISEGSYGAGSVMIWDYGTYVPEVEQEKGKREVVQDEKEGEKVMQKGLEKGELKFLLFGKKLQGSFALIKTKGFGPKNSWLMIKHNDEYVQKDYDAKEYDFSAVSNRSLQKIKDEGETA